MTRNVSIIGAALAGLRIIAGSFRRYRPTVPPIIYDPAVAERWRLMVDAADRFDVFPDDDDDDDTPIRYTLTDKASA